MKRTPISLAFVLLMAVPQLNANTPKAGDVTSRDGRYTYRVVQGDDMGTRIYTLKNGLTVMMSVNKAEPRLQTLIAVKAGSKMDPADNTGLAHYLEHMLFKGTDRFGTRDWPREKAALDVIELLYEEYNQTTDPTLRRSIYKSIDSASSVAATFAIANEYDKLMSVIGAKGTNAFTSSEQTVYVNDIPSNQLNRWLEVEAERFRNPVLRLFHTELEAVYEEKNISLDNDDEKVFEKLFGDLFRNHAYGTQTTIGTVEHLKNPSLKKIRDYYNTYYVPNNMAIVIAGDFDPDQAIVWIDEKFGGMEPRPVPTYTFQQEARRSRPLVSTVLGPDPESITIGYRFPGAGTREADLLTVTDALLSYKSAGLIDLNLVQGQKALEAFSHFEVMKDYSFGILSGKPMEGQKLEELEKLLLNQVKAVKAGQFEESTLQAIVRNLRKDLTKRYESNNGRAFTMLGSFVFGIDWEQEVGQLDRLAKITKKEIIDFANRYYGEDRVVVYKRIGKDPKTVKVEKPEITPVAVNRDAESEFVTRIMAEKVAPVSPAFLDYSKDISRLTTAGGLPVSYLPNTENKLYSLYYVFDMGSRNDKKLAFAIDYLEYLGTAKYNAEQIRKEFFKLAGEFSVSSEEDQVYVTLSGLDENFDDAVKLFEEFLTNVRPDQEALDLMVAGVLKERADAKLDKSQVLWEGLVNYAMYGKKNPFTDQLSEAELKSLKAEDLVKILRSLTTYQHKVYYYGPASRENVVAVIDRHHRVPAALKPVPAANEYARRDIGENVVYFVDMDMVQAEIVWIARSEQFDPDLLPSTYLFNEYYGGGMSSVIFQTIRESKALAYSTFSQYAVPDKKTDPYYVLAYIGTQADKLPQAMTAMNELLTDMPKTEQAFTTAKTALRNKLETERIRKTRIFFNQESAQKLGLDHDLRRDVYENLDNITLNDLSKFHESHFRNKPFAYCVMGSKEKIDLKELGKHGKVVEVSREEIFGY